MGREIGRRKRKGRESRSRAKEKSKGGEARYSRSARDLRIQGGSEERVGVREERTGGKETKEGEKKRGRMIGR